MGLMTVHVYIYASSETAGIGVGKMEWQFAKPVQKHIKYRQFKLILASLE